MNVKQFLSLLIKAVGLFLFVKAMLLFPNVLAFAFTSLSMSDQAFSILFLQILIFIMYCLITYWALFKSDWIADKLLNNDMKTEQVIAFKIHRSVVLSIAIIAAGLFIFINELPDFIYKFGNYFLNEQFKEKGLIRQSSIQLLSSAIELIIGYLLFSKSSYWVKIIEKKRK